MAAVSQKTLSWLWDVLQREYRDPQRAYLDLAQALALYPGFAPRTDVYTNDRGSSALLLHLKGTIPVDFRGGQYRFPISIWIPHTYPHDSPICYVTPTDDMVVRPGQYVSPSDGRVYHPYLARWREAWERSTVADFLKLLADIFAREPPVMARQQVASQDSRPPLPHPPMPVEQGQRPGRPLSVAGSSFSRPPPTPPKTAATNDGVGLPTPSPPVPQGSGRYDVPPPLPGQATAPRPTSMSSQPTSGHFQQPQLLPQRQSNLRQPYSPQSQPVSAYPYQTQRQSISGPPHYPNQRPASVQQQPPQPMQSDQAQYFAQQRFPTQSIQSGSSHQIVPHVQSHLRQHQTHVPQLQPRASQAPPQQPNIMDDSPFEVTLSAPTANIPTPAIPPNPERQHILDSLQTTLLTTLHSQITQSTLAIAPLQSQYVALQSAQQGLQQEMNQLQVLQTQLQQNVDSLTSTISSADRTIGSARNESSSNKTPSVDELVIPPTVVARQLYDSVAEQRSYEAAIFALTEGFVRGRIGGEMWARKTRECAREEFRRKWLVKRVGTGMGLDVSQLEGSL